MLSAILSFLLKPFDLGNPLYGSILSVTPIISGLIGCFVTSKFLRKNLKFK